MTTKRGRMAMLLGAGASVDAGMPSAAGLTKRLDDWLTTERRELLPALRFVNGAVQFGKSCRGEAVSASTNIEEILAACSFLGSRSGSSVYPFVGAWHEQLATLERAFMTAGGVGSPFDELAVVCKQQLRAWLAIEVDEASRVKYLWSLHGFVGAGFDLDVFTLNYDSTVELALQTSRGEVNTAWTTGFDESGWNPNLLERDFALRIFKLHGSLDWIRDEKLGLCSLRWPAATNSEEIPESAESLLIFGTDTKLQAVDPFLTLLYGFQRSLFMSAALIIVGYSFGDKHVNDIIWEAMQRDAQKRCIVVNPAGIEQLFAGDTKLSRLVDVENRFREIKTTAKDALERDLALAELKSVLQEQASEEPF
jgi:hypothetical protein